MYHYVRDLVHSRYPDIKGLDTRLFVEQVEYLQKHYNFITMEELIEATYNGHQLPPNAVMLTFDDAYTDHFTNVFPVLEKRKIQGSFFAPVKAITENKILDVNKIHFILASVDDKGYIVKELYKQLDHYREAYHLESNEHYHTKLAVLGKYDTAEVTFIKKLLQTGLVEELRTLIIDNLFRKFVSSDEVSFSRELYLNTEQIECMQRNGMHIGGHGDNHYWLGTLTKQQQYNELSKSLEFIKSIGGDVNNWTMCYPFGDYNQDTIDILTELNCKLGFTTQVEITDASQNHKYKLPRLNTNDIPKDRNAPTNAWFDKIKL